MAYIRDNQNIIKGDELWLFIGIRDVQNPTTPVSVANMKPVAFATQHSLSRSLNTTSVSSKDHGNTSYVVPGEGSWTCSTESLMSMTGTGNSVAFEEIMDAFEAGLLFDVVFGTISNYTGKGIVDVNVEGTKQANGWEIDTDNCWVGKGYMTSLQASGGHGDSATFSCEITGIGPLEPNE